MKNYSVVNTVLLLIMLPFMAFIAVKQWDMSERVAKMEQKIEDKYGYSDTTGKHSSTVTTQQ